MRTMGARPIEGHGRLGRLGLWTAGHGRLVIATWGIALVGLGLVAPRAEHALSGAGWAASGSESVAARRASERAFDGRGAYALAVVVSSSAHTVAEPSFRATLARVERILAADPAVAAVFPPTLGATISRDGKLAIVTGGAARSETEMVRAADRLRGDLHRAGAVGVDVALTGSAGLWSDFNRENKAAMLRSELLSWPLTLAILVLAFGSLVAAGLPLVLAVLGLVATAGVLWLGTHLGEITIWAMNFALMFALAVGIDYALFLVARFRSELRAGLSPHAAVGAAMDTAGKAVLVSGLTVIASLTAVMLVPSQPFRTGAFGIALAVGFVLAGSLTLLPALLALLGSRVDRFALPWRSAVEHRSPAFARWAELIWRRPVALGGGALGLLLLLALPLRGLETGMPTVTVVPEQASSRLGQERLQLAMGPGAASQLDLVVPAARAAEVAALLTARADVAAVRPPLEGNGLALVRAIPVADGRDVGATIDAVRAALPPGALLGGAVAESHDLERALASRTPLVYAAILGLGFLLLLLILHAPIVSAAAVLMNLLATGAAFGVARLIFQDGRGEGLLGFESQGHLNAWAPVFFFALIFALAMDYTVFLLASVKERVDRGLSAREAAVGGLAASGRVINAAALVMVFVFFTFALSGPLPPKEMGIILGIAVLLDATLVRLLLLPAALRLLGERAWWIPRWVDRWFPQLRFDHGGALRG